MSEAELHEPGAEEVATTEPPRIPLRIWHWFVWILATVVLMAIIDVREMRPLDLDGWWQVGAMVLWAAQSGLVLTAALAAFHVARQRHLPDEVRWSPGHFLLSAFLISALMAVALFITIKHVSFTSRLLSLLRALGLVSTVAVIVIAAFAFRQVKSRAWRLFFGAWIAVSILKRVLSFAWIGVYDAFYIIPFSFDLICLVLLTCAVVSDVKRRPRAMYHRTWTHWAGVLAAYTTLVPEMVQHVWPLMNPW